MAEEKNAVERYIDFRYDNAHVSKIRLGKDHHLALQDWIKKPSGFVILLGIPGCGKTFTAIAITRALYAKAKLYRQHPQIFFYPQAKIYDEFRECYNNNWTDLCLKEKLNDALLLTIDDFGSTRNNEWQAEIMTQIIDSRYASKRPTILTSNLTFEQIASTFHPRVRSRLEASENLIITDWETDLRQENL